MIFFVNGFMGSGKSHWGKLWASNYKLAFADLDEAIAMQERKTVNEIFESKGEAYFRTVESAMLRKLSESRTTTIIACGGGTPCYGNNMEWMNEHGISIYLSATPDEILRRLVKGQEQQQRPLIKKLNQAELLFFIEKKLKEREPFYTQANIIIPSSEVTEHTFEEQILTY